MKKRFITLLAVLCAAVGLAGLSACDPGGLNAGGSEQGGTSDTGDTGNTGNTDNTGDNTDNTGDNTGGTDNTGDNTGDKGDNTGDEPAPHEHVYSEWEIVVPTADAEGSATRTCQTCDETAEGHSVTRTLPVLSDDGYSTVHTDATCASVGWDTYTITVEGDEISFLVVNEEKLPHTYSEWEIVAPTADAEGSATHTCQACDETAEGHSVTRMLPVLSDESYSTVHSGPTCAAYGGDTYTVTVEDDEISFFIVTDEKLPHTYVYAVDEVPRFASLGVALGTCSVCQKGDEGHERRVPIPALGSDAYTVEKLTDATCTESGTATYTTTVEGQTLSFTGATKELGHTFEKAEKGYACSACGETVSQPFVGNYYGTWHNYDDSQTLVITSKGATLNGEEIAMKTGATGAPGTITLDGIAYSTSLKTVTFGTDEQSVLYLSGKIPVSNLPLYQIFYRADYPIEIFPEELLGAWEAKLKSGDFAIEFSGRALISEGSPVLFSKYTPTATGFSIFYTVGTMVGDVAIDYGEYTVAYDSTTGILTVTDELAWQSKPVECEKSEVEGALFPEYEGTYVSEGGDTIVFDEEGRCFYNGKQVSLSPVHFDAGTPGAEEVTYRYEFHTNNTSFVMMLAEALNGTITLTCPAWHIENEPFTLQQPAE